MKSKMNIKQYILNYKFNSLFLKNLVRIFCLMMIPVIGAGGIAYFSYRYMQEKDICAYGSEITRNVYDDLQNILKSAQTELIYIGFNSDVELYMYEMQNVQEFNKRVRTIQDLIRLPIISKDYVKDIYIYSYENNHVVTLSSFEHYETFSQKPCLDAYRENGREESCLMVTTRQENGLQKQQLSLYEPIRYGKKALGIACMNFDVDELGRLLAIPKGGTLYLTNGEQILYSNDKGMVGAKRSEIPNIQALSGEKVIRQGGQVLSVVQSEEAALEIITSLEVSGYQNQLNSIRIFSVLFLIFMLIAVLLLTMYVSVRIFHPIDEIIQEIRKNQSILIPEDKLFQEHDELSYILTSIKKTTDLKKDVDKELSERVHLLKKAQAIALQSQINPHFLNNTLNTINWISISLLGGKNKISEMITALSKMFRMTLENTDSIISLSKEIEHCKYYIDIQNIRYEGKYTVEWHIPKELYQYKTIRIVLQPIVENAIYHGVKYLSANGVITISGKAENGLVELEVKDNGLGMSPQELDELKAHMNAESIQESRHIGLANVNQRLKLYFGNEYGVFIESREGQGTQVLVRFPQIT